MIRAQLVANWQKNKPIWNNSLKSERGGEGGFSTISHAKWTDHKFTTAYCLKRALWPREMYIKL